MKLATALVASILSLTTLAARGALPTDDGYSVTVKFADLDLDDKAGIAKLYVRIRGAARRVCDQQAIDDPAASYATLREARRVDSRRSHRPPDAVGVLRATRQQAGRDRARERRGSLRFRFQFHHLAVVQLLGDSYEDCLTPSAPGPHRARRCTARCPDRLGQRGRATAAPQSRNSALPRWSARSASPASATAAPSRAPMA